ncbi:hypothetical protein DCAR_0417801 [Daucus carota subsp. sativus]|uniref:non-specific serine/threonine protein kinase n=1 Tax=Daucus carota subsp. sativus TaxID=79200 RepID=A0AAF1AWX7_DAUCS|nr:hypothetical protein DCAR_0417801 [Daucus carota subsp. sativus]
MGCTVSCSLISRSTLAYTPIIYVKYISTKTHQATERENKVDSLQTLRAIAVKLNIKHWDVKRSSCSGGGGLSVLFDIPQPLSNVTCDCTFSNHSVCHVTHIHLKRLNLTGELPSDFSKLAFLQELDLVQNYINGTIPVAFGQLPLKTLNLLDNRISGSIPREIANIDMLEELILEDNQLGGPLPPELGNLGSLRRLLLSSNNFIGTIPESYGTLKNLKDFRIDGSRLSGKIPDFIGNWTNIKILNLQGTSMEGPIPSSISLLKNLIEFRISDLNGYVSSFPNLRDMTNMTYLILRNCLIEDSIPPYIAEMRSLYTLDLSFNRLSGRIPDSIQPLKSSLNFLYLNSNLLSGVIPRWISDSNKNFDVSYNNFTQSTSLYRCQASRVNLVSSHSYSTSNLTPWCLKKDLPCPRTIQYHSLFVNCGGPQIKSGGNEYVQDLVTEGASYFYSTDRWAYSSTGVFISNDKSNFVARKANVTGDEYYQTARLSPSSLKYYGLCLQKGSYKVRLHFAEIQFSDDETYGSIGRRIFDVSIQGNIVWKDFNIAEKAGGIGKGITLEKDVTVNSSTLEIHLHWSGKGTTAVPDRGVYGPLISAISVTPNFVIKKREVRGLSIPMIAGILVASIVSLALMLYIFWMKGFLGGKYVEDKELRGAIEQKTGYFSLRQIKAATGNFNHANKVGEGGFGPVYKGILPDGQEIAVKQLSSKSKQGNREFLNEIGLISALQHPNLVKLHGCCIEGNQLLLIYEYLENNSLAQALYGRDRQLNLVWTTRKKILLGIARSLAYLHEESRLKIVHRDIKATNVLLDRDLNAKISDFGLAKLDEEENTHISTRVAGTLGYMAPEYAMLGHLTAKADVYSFGIVALETVSGRSNTDYILEEEFVSLLDRAYVLQEQGNLLEIVDPILGTNYSKQEATSVINIALLCTSPSPSLRPCMSAVVSMLQGKRKVEAPVVASNTTCDYTEFKGFENITLASQTRSSMFSGKSLGARSVSSMDWPWDDSSVSMPSKDTSRLVTDLYDVILD